MGLNLFLSIISLSDLMTEKIKKFLLRGKYKNDSKNALPESWYIIDNVPLTGSTIPLEEMIKARAVKNSKPTYAVAESVRKECKFPDNVAFIQRGNYVDIQVKTKSTEDAKRVIESNKSCIENTLGTVEIDLDKFKFRK